MCARERAVDGRLQAVGSLACAFSCSLKCACAHTRARACAHCFVLRAARISFSLFSPVPAAATRRRRQRRRQRRQRRPQWRWRAAAFHLARVACVARVARVRPPSDRRRSVKCKQLTSWRSAVERRRWRRRRPKLRVTGGARWRRASNGASRSHACAHVHRRQEFGTRIAAIYELRSRVRRSRTSLFIVDSTKIDSARIYKIAHVLKSSCRHSIHSLLIVVFIACFALIARARQQSATRQW